MDSVILIVAVLLVCFVVIAIALLRSEPREDTTAIILKGLQKPLWYKEDKRNKPHGYRGREGEGYDDD